MKQEPIHDTDIPLWVWERLARWFLPQIQAFFASEAGRQEYAQWEAEQRNSQSPGIPSTPDGGDCSRT